MCVPVYVFLVMPFDFIPFPQVSYPHDTRGDAQTQHIEEAQRHNQLAPSADSVRERAWLGPTAAAQSAPRGAIFASVVHRIRE